MITNRSQLPVMQWRPLVEKQTADTGAALSDQQCNREPRRSHNRAVQSIEPESSEEPSAEKAQAETGAVCPISLRTSPPDLYPM